MSSNNENLAMQRIAKLVDENSFMHRVQLEMQISDLRQQIDKYNTQNEDDMRKLKELNHDPGAYQKIARERYFMQTDDEDIYVLSDDKKTESDNNETNE